MEEDWIRKSFILCAGGLLTDIFSVDDVETIGKTKFYCDDKLFMRYWGKFVLGSGGFEEFYYSVWYFILFIVS